MQAAGIKFEFLNTGHEGNWMEIKTIPKEYFYFYKVRAGRLSLIP
jgi:hypothetical protein